LSGLKKEELKLTTKNHNYGKYSRRSIREKRW
jgi:hypothetical protein